jgi:hypothetical protein
MWKRILFGIALAALLPFGVQAQVVTKTPLVVGQWTEIGACPVHLSAIGNAWYAMTASSSVGPTLGYEGHPIPLNGIDVNCANTGFVWARGLSVTDNAIAYSSPIVAGGGGGGGGGAITSPLTGAGSVQIDTSDVGGGNLISAINAPIAAQASAGGVVIGAFKLADGATTANPGAPLLSVTAPGTAPTVGLAGVQGDGALSIPVSMTPPTVTAGNLVTGVTAAMTGTTSTQVIALVSSKRIYVTTIQCNNTHASIDSLVNIQDGSAGTTLWTIAASHGYGGEANSGVTPLFWTTAGNGLYAADVTTGASVICSASGYSG